MECHRLAERISQLDAELPAIEVARLCLLILNSPQVSAGSQASAGIDDEVTLRRLCKAASFRLKAAADQYAAMSEELDAICIDGPKRFSPDQIWTLVRAIKVQSQILDLYTDQPAWV